MLRIGYKLYIEEVYLYLPFLLFQSPSFLFSITLDIQIFIIIFFVFYTEKNNS